jgi:CubicO group peptidase (beta-lactamase class C family)
MNLQTYIENICRTHQIPALSVAVSYKDRVYAAATGVLNIATDVAATTDAIFQIGSITKVLTASLIMQLVDEGRLELDAPVKTYLRDFQLGDVNAAQSINVGQLLDHSSGIAGDFLPATAWPDDNSIARYVDRCNLLPSVHQPGARHSYSNAAYNIAGRLIEVVLGCSWFDAIEERIFKPLGLRQAAVHPSQVIRYRAAMGHVPKPDQKSGLMISPSSHLSMAWAPVGSAIMMSASDLVRFACAHINQGRGENGEQWLSAESVAVMQKPRVSLPQGAYPFASQWGLGWQICQAGSTAIIGHGGSVTGQNAMLRFLPEQDIAFAICQNVIDENVLMEISQYLLAELAGITVPDLDAAAIFQSDNLQAFAGTYNSIDASLFVFVVDGVVRIDVKPRRSSFSPYSLRLQMVNEQSFIAYTQEGERVFNVVFEDFDRDNVPASLYFSFRLFNRVLCS